jgi:8-oxo-dGTP pyrophosphatase MutT (NUDIX family)
MSKAPARNQQRDLQYAALPFRRGARDALEVMLITSRGSKRWIIPKGWPVEKLAPHDSAAREALEEGGVIGRIGKGSIGAYQYEKRHDDGTTTRCTVTVFALEVEKQLASWHEKDERSTRWFALPEAARAVAEPELSAMIRNLAALLTSA